MNILYINHYAGSLNHGMEYRPYYLAREWVKLGHKVTIIASNFSHIRSQNIVMPDKQSYLHEQIDGIDYIWCKTPPYPENGIKRVINIFTFLYRVRKLIPYFTKWYKYLGNYAFDKPDIVIASSTYPFDTKVAYKIAKKVNAKFVYEVHDLWPLTPIELGGMSKYHPFIYLMQRAENFGYKHADKVVSLLPKARGYMQEHGMHPDKFVYIPNGVSISETLHCQDTMPQSHIDKIDQIKQEYQFLIGYLGGMGESNALEYLISAAAKITKISQISGPKVAFVLVGDGVCKELLIKRAQDENIDNVFFLPAIAKIAVPDFLRRMDVLYIGWHKLSIYRFGICPNKLFDYMLSAKPIIHSMTAGNDLVQEAKCGITVAAEDIDAIIGAIEQITNLSPEELKKMGDNGHEYVIANHDYAILAQKFITVIAGGRKIHENT
jgi:glycosyltransferase involved in cell wall biosynthesis